jgi:MYXO-CTERM domain-containing protein
MQPSLALRPLIATDGTYPSRNSPPADGLPAEGIGSSGAEPYLGEVAWVAHNNIPQGWARAEGQLVPIQNNDALFSLLGTMYGGDGRTTFALPDLRGRAAIGEGQAPGLSRWRMGEKGGQETETLSLNQTPSHKHELPNGLGDTQSAGGNAAQSNLQPSLGLRYVVPLVGVFPPQPFEPASDDGPAAGLGGSTEPYIGSLSMVAFNFAPSGFADAAGQLLPINQYSALYSIIENTYGGTLPTTFGLPDLRGRVPLGVGQGPNLSDRARGQQFGAQSSVLTVANLPEHTHEFVVAGDYNEDGTVDAADYSVWRDHVGEPPGTLPNDDSGKPIGQGQYDVWRANYGNSVGPTPTVLQQAAAPEPTAAWLTLCALGAAVLRRRRRS